MPVKPVTDWISTYKSKLEDHYKAAADNPAIPIQKFWSDWVDSNAQGLNAAPPYNLSKATTDMGKFAPVVFGNPGTPPEVAQVLSGAWQSWYLGIQWSKPPPIPPFSVIQSVESSPTGTLIAYATLFAALIAEMAVVPPDPILGWAIKATAFGTMFNTATVAGGIQISGLDLEGKPLVIPLLPVL